MKIRGLIFLMLLAVGACIDPLNVDTNEAPKRLIVDGLITDQEGQYFVKLYYSINLSTSVGVNFEPVENATVYIIELAG